MLANKNIICISSIDWDFIWQGHQEIMSAFAKNGNRVLFIENTGVRAPGIRDIARIRNRIKNWLSGVSGIRKIQDNLYVFSPILLPFPYLRIAMWINRHMIFSVLEKWIKVMDFSHPVIWAFLPTPLSLNLIDSLDPEAVVYYCIDNFRVSSVQARKIKDSEIRLLKKSDLVFVTSRELYNYCAQYTKKVYIFPFAVNFKEFEEARQGKSYVPVELKDISKPIIGYVGGVHKWVDLKLIKEAAEKNTQYSFVFIGPVQTDISLLAGLKNIYFLGKKEHREIPYFINSFDACIIPYSITEYTKNVYPTKLNEYLAMGKPVVSTELPEIIDFNSANAGIVLTAKTADDFSRCISNALRNNSAEAVSKRILSAKKNSWPVRIEEMSNLLEGAINGMAKVPIDWQERFFKFCKASKRRVFKAGLVILAIYLILFYTPLVWISAKPLTISNLPEKADCIVVFAGGVGESGKAGQGYQERVKYAVDLYRKGYAGHMLFSSGYMYIFKEPLVMKALAVSLGVPEEAIILEDKASGTYQNVKFAKDILLSRGWGKIILVSPPQHMRRVSLVFNKIFPQEKVIYLPLPMAHFYPPGKTRSSFIFSRQISLEQARRILHEYLAIIYYCWKGYI